MTIVSLLPIPILKANEAEEKNYKNSERPLTAEEKRFINGLGVGKTFTIRQKSAASKTSIVKNITREGFHYTEVEGGSQSFFPYANALRVEWTNEPNSVSFGKFYSFEEALEGKIKILTSLGKDFSIGARNKKTYRVSSRNSNGVSLIEFNNGSRVPGTQKFYLYTELFNIVMI